MLGFNTPFNFSIYDSTSQTWTTTPSPLLANHWNVSMCQSRHRERLRLRGRGVTENTYGTETYTNYDGSLYEWSPISRNWTRLINVNSLQTRLCPVAIWGPWCATLQMAPGYFWCRRVKFGLRTSSASILPGTWLQAAATTFTDPNFSLLLPTVRPVTAMAPRGSLVLA